MTKHAVVIVGSGPTGLMLAGELALAGIDVAIVEQRASQELDGSRSGGLHSRTIDVLVELYDGADGQSLRADYVVRCDRGRSDIL